MLTIMAVAISACSGGKSIKISKDGDNVKIEGDIDGHVEVVPGTYEITKTDTAKNSITGETMSALTIKVKLKLKDAMTEGEINMNTIAPVLMVLDAENHEINREFKIGMDVWMDTTYYDIFRKFLLSPVDTEVEIPFTVVTSDKKDIEKIMKEGKGIKILTKEMEKPDTQDNNGTNSWSWGN